MRLSIESKSSAGLVRKRNEDSLGFWQPEEEAEKLRHGAISVMADGGGGHENGDVASKMAVEIALATFQRMNPVNAPKQILKQIFDSANLAIYEAGMADPRGGRVATTLSGCIFPHKKVLIGHIRDPRVYLVRQENLRRLTDDHSYTAMQVKLRLISEHEAKASRLRSMLTRSLGPEPIVHFDFKRIKLMSRDRIVQCTDGLYCFMNDGELLEGVDRLDMDEICPYLVSLAERGGTDDNLSAQVIQVDRLVEPKYDQPISILKKTGGGQPVTMTNEVKPGD